MLLYLQNDRLMGIPAGPPPTIATSACMSNICSVRGPWRNEAGLNLNAKTQYIRYRARRVHRTVLQRDVIKISKKSSAWSACPKVGLAWEACNNYNVY